MNLKSTFDENYDASLGKVVYSSSRPDTEATQDPNEINATEDVTTFTFEPVVTQDPNIYPYDPDSTTAPENPDMDIRPTIETITEPPTDNDDEEDNSNNGGNNGNGNNFPGFNHGN